jgi:hypothetical protein
MSRRLGGGSSFQIAHVDGQVQTALVSDGIVAWLVDNGDRSPSWIETARIPDDRLEDAPLAAPGPVRDACPLLGCWWNCGC